MAATVHIQKSLDVICQHKKDGSIIPLKIRLQDEDGEYQSYQVKSYRCAGLTDSITKPGYSTMRFDCKISSFGQERTIGLSYCYSDGLWKILGRDL